MDKNSTYYSAKTLRIGLICFALLFGVFGVWASFAPLKSAAIAVGKIVLSNNVKVIQHLEGGIIKEIHIKEGDVVKKGDKLITLDDTQAKSSLEMVNNEYVTQKANEVRLIAESLQKDKVEYPIEIPEQLIKDQNELFQTRRESYTSELEILQQQIEQLNKQVEGLESQKDSLEKNLKIMRADIKKSDRLIKKKIITRPVYEEQKKQLNSTQGEYGAIISEIAKTGKAINEAQLSIINLKSRKYNEVITELKEVRKALKDIEEQRLVASDISTRTIITAPVSGVVTAKKFSTIGGVISGATEVMRIVPQNDKLLIDARLSPNDVDNVFPGSKARVRLSAYKARNIPMFNAVVKLVSPDTFIDEATGEEYYLIKVEVASSEFKDFDIELYPGMKIELYITTGSRTLLKYLLDPITQTMRRGFKED